MYTLEQLRGFVAVAEEGNFGRAAHRLRITQPPLSRQVQKLEREVGVDLIRRTPRGAALTPAGRVFLDEARRLLTLAGEAPLIARRAATGTEGTVRMGFTAIAALSVLGRWANLAGRRLPEVDLVLTEMVTGVQVAELLSGGIDIGLLRGLPRAEALPTERVHAETLLAAVPAGHELTERDLAPSVLDIADFDVVTYAPGDARYFHELVVSTFQAAGAAPRYVQYASQVTSVVALVDAGVGVALIPESASTLRLPHVEFLPIADIAPDCVEVHCAWHRDNDNPAMAALLAHARTQGYLPAGS